MKKFYIFNQNVCTRLSLFGDDLKNLLLKNDWRESDQKSADYLFINSCAFLKRVEDKAVKNIVAIDNNRSANQKMVVFGCLPYINFRRLRAVFSGEIIMARELDEFMAKLDLKFFPDEISHQLNRRLNWQSKINQIINRYFIKNSYLEYLNGGRAFYLKIASGCLGNCSYCAEKSARGILRSRKISEVVSQFNQGVNSGYQIFSFNADDVGVYGWDNQENIAALLREVIALPYDFKLMLTEFNPWGLIRFKEEMLPILKSKKIAHLTVPLQSGSDKILASMNRNYKIADLMDILLMVRLGNRDLVLNTHLIVGFPGETEEDFQKTKSLVSLGLFDKVKIFKYSDHPHVGSYLLKDKVAPKTIDRRYNDLRKLVICQNIKRLNLRNILLNFHFRY